MQHIHMSTSFALVLALFVIGFVAVVGAFIVSIRRDNRARREWQDRKAYTSGPYASPSNPRAGENVRGTGYIPPSYPAAAAPVTVMHNGGGTDMLTGMMVGSMLSNHGGYGGNTTIINEAPASSYDSGPSDSGFTYDSGSSSGGSDFGGGGGCDFGGGGD